MLHVLKTPVYRFDLYGRYQTLSNLVWIGRSMCSKPQFTDLTYIGATRSCGSTLPIFYTNQRMGNISLDAAIGCCMCSRPQFTDLTYMGGTGSGGPMRIIFGGVIKSWCTSLSITFGAVYRFGLYGRYQILWTDTAHFQYQPAYG